MALDTFGLDNMTSSDLSNKTIKNTKPISYQIWDATKYGGKMLGKAATTPLALGIKGIQGTGNILKDMTHSTTQQDLYNFNVGDKKFSINQQDLYNFAKQNGFEGTFSQFVNNQDDLQSWGDSYAVDKGASKLGSWNTEFNSTFDLGKTLGSAQDIANLGLSGWQLYQNIDSYGIQKDLLKKQKDLLEQQITNNRENMDYVRKERARQDTMRSNVSAQRNSESNVRSF